MTDEALQEILCCIGYPVAGNPTQYVMEKALAEADLDLRYLTLEVTPENLGDAARGMRAMGFLGCHIFEPHKTAIVQYLDELTDAARLTGAVNTVFRNGQGLYIGENTDGKGLLESLKETTEPEGKKAVILGASSAARAIAVELGLAGAASLTIVGRTEESGSELVRTLNETGNFTAEFVPWEGNVAIPEGTDILVDATSIGYHDPSAEPAIDCDTLDPSMIVADVVFNPIETLLLRTAAERGCRTIDGLGMLINQGALGFHIWTDIWPNKILMREAIEEFLML